MDFETALELTQSKAAAIYYSNNFSKERYANKMATKLKEEFTNIVKRTQSSIIKSYINEVERQNNNIRGVVDKNGNIGTILKYLLSIVNNGLYPSRYTKICPPDDLIFEKYITKNQTFNTEFTPFKVRGFVPINEKIRGSMRAEAAASLMEAIVDHKLFFTSDNNRVQMFFLTPDITIDYLDTIKIDFGRFLICYSCEKKGRLFESIVNSGYSHRLLAKPLSGIVHPNSPYAHPHVSTDGSICMGEGARPLYSMLQNGLFYEAAEVIISVLKTYNPSSPYSPIDKFERIAPHNQKCCITKKFISKYMAIECRCGRIRNKGIEHCACYYMKK